MAKVKSRVGATNVSCEGYKMECIEYRGVNDITVRFENGYVTNARWGNFDSGKIKNVYHKSVQGVGYLGEGKYSPSKDEKKVTSIYKVWVGMLWRCYSPKEYKVKVSYEKCTVDPVWHNFQNFAKWYEDNAYDLEGERLHLDKDILVKGNSVYSPSTCILTPQKINTLFINGTHTEGLPVGVTRKAGKFVANMKLDGGQVYLGIHATPEEAFEAYKQAKEQYIKEVAETYKDRIPERLYNAIKNYSI